MNSSPDSALREVVFSSSTLKAEVGWQKFSVGCRESVVFQQLADHELGPDFLVLAFRFQFGESLSTTTSFPVFR